MGLTAADAGSPMSSAAAVRRTGSPIRALLRLIQAVKVFVYLVVSGRRLAALEASLTHRGCLCIHPELGRVWAAKGDLYKLPSKLRRELLPRTA